MKPFTRSYERRHFKRFEMTTRDCRLTLIRRRGGERERQSCILVNLSYAGFRFQGPLAFRNGEMVVEAGEESLIVAELSYSPAA